MLRDIHASSSPTGARGCSLFSRYSPRASTDGKLHDDLCSCYDWSIVMVHQMRKELMVPIWNDLVSSLFDFVSHANE
jgi:hypothetical protein